LAKVSQAFSHLKIYLFYTFSHFIYFPIILFYKIQGGFKAVSVILEGKFYHEDFKGHKGFIRAGDVQWLTKGRGIVHSETPKYDETSRVRALQIWINLSRQNKMIEPIF